MNDDPFGCFAAGALVVVALAGALLIGWPIGRDMGADSRTAWIRADLAQQGCVLVLEDAGEGQTWRVECEGEGR
jgi:hypothetical protein